MRLTITNLEDQRSQDLDIDNALLAAGVVIGRAAGCGICLDRNTVSRSHARLQLSGETVQLTDLDSTAGTELNGKPVKPQEPLTVAAGDRIGLGGFELSWSADEAADDDFAEMTMAAGPAPRQYQPVALVADDAWETWPSGQLPVTCVRVMAETHDVTTFVFQAAPQVLFRYKPGQFVTLHLEIEGKPVVRSYTISSTPSRPHTFSITVKRVPASGDHPPGLVSNWLHDNLQAGDGITVSGPFGDFTCHEHPAPKLCLLSAGSGITPMLSMARWLCDTAAGVDIVFVHLARTAADLICRRELEDLAAHHPKLRLVFSLSRPGPTEIWSGLVGRLGNAQLRQAVEDLDRREVFVCGPGPFMDAMKRQLQDSGYPMEHHHEESFGGPAAKPSAPSPATGSGSSGSHAAVDKTPRFGLKALLGKLGKPGPGADEPTPAGGSAPLAAADAGGPQITLAKSGATIACEPGKSILEAAEAAGHQLPCACRMGVCGACKAVLSKGEIDRSDGYQDGVLSDADRAAGYVLTCIGKPAGSCEVDA